MSIINIHHAEALSLFEYKASMETLGTRLRKLREKKGISQKDLARNLGISASTYRDWEYGKKIKGEKPYLALAQFFQVSLHELLTGQKGEVQRVILQIEELEKNVKNIKETVLTI